MSRTEFERCQNFEKCQKMINPMGIRFSRNMSNSYKNGFTEYMGNLIIRQGTPKYGKYSMDHIIWV